MALVKFISEPRELEVGIDSSNLPSNNDVLQYSAVHDIWFTRSLDNAGIVAKALYDANTILAATTDDTPVAVTIAEQTVVGRLTGGNIDDVAIGIADNNIVQIDQVDAADNDFAKFTANGLEGRSYTETRQDLGLATTDSPVFVTAKLSGLADGKIPYHVNDATGLADGPTKTDVDDAVTKKHVAVTLDANADTLLSLSTQQLGLDTQNANTVLAGPTTGAAAVPSFRSLVEADLPSTVVLESDVDDVPVDGATAAPVSSNWAFDVTTALNEPTGLETRPTLSIALGVLSITGDHRLWMHGILYSKTTATVDMSAFADSLWYVYYDSAGTLQTSQTAWSLFTTAQVAIVYKNGSEFFLCDERHGPYMDCSTHNYLHYTRKTAYREGLVAVFNNTTMDISNGSFDDEDIHHTVTGASTYQVQVFYRDASLNWLWTALQDNWWKAGVGGRPQWDNAGTLTELDNAKYGVYYLIGINGYSTKLVTIMGQATYNTLVLARAADYTGLSLGTMPSPEIKVLYKVIVQATASSGTFVETLDLRGNPQLAGTAPVLTDHGSLSGLNDDDHPQYLLVTNIDDTPVDGETAQPISSNWAFDHTATPAAHHALVTVSSPLSVTGQALSLVNDAAAAVTEVDTGTLASSNTVIPSSLAVVTAIATAISGAAVHPYWQILAGETVTVQARQQYGVFSRLDNQGTISLGAGAELFVGMSNVETMSKTSGGLEMYCSEATVTLSGSTSIIPIAVPSNCYLEGAQLRVDTAVTGASSWNAYFSGGNTSVIGTVQSNSQNTKVNSHSGGFTSDVTNISIVKTGSNFSGGVIRAIAYYRKFTAMDSV